MNLFSLIGYKIKQLIRLVIWSCIVFLPANADLIDIIFWLLVFNFILSDNRWSTIKENFLFIILMIQYPIYNIIRIYFTSDHNFEIITPTAQYDMWIYCILGVILASIFFNEKTTEIYAKVALPLSLLLVFSLAAYSFHFLNIDKVTLWNGMVFKAPLFASTISIILFGMLKFNNYKAVITSIAILSPMLILSIAYAGTRGIFIGQTISLFVAALVYLFDRNITKFLALILSISFGIVTGFLIDNFYNSDFSERFRIVLTLISSHYNLVAFIISIMGLFIIVLAPTWNKLKQHISINTYIFTLCSVFIVIGYMIFTKLFHLDHSIVEILNDFQNTASVIDPNTSLRLRFLEIGLSELQGHLIFGRGAYIEPYLAEIVIATHLHLHNNYLSWLIWGGAVGLFSGLTWLLAPIFIIQNQFYRIPKTPLLMIGLLWSVSLLFDSFFSWTNFTYVYILLTCMAYYIHKERSYDFCNDTHTS